MTDNNNENNETDNGEPTNSGIEKISIYSEMKNSYLDYAMSVIVGRALPDVRDGLKPVHRRALYSMQTLNNYHNKPFLKSARVVGDVIGKYHPHGDTAVYNTIVRMAQDFSLRYPLIDGQGNFGSIDGDSAAAMRYTEIRMKKMSEDMLKDLEKETVDWQPNYDESLQEPTVLPTKVPNLLVNGSAGIAVGMATNIPPHNITEIMNGLFATIDNPEISIAELMAIIPGPDFPTAGSIHGLEGIRSAFFTGKGVIQLRAKLDVESHGRDRERIVITELPYQVNKAKLIEKIAELVNHKLLIGISDIRDESNRLGIRVVIDLKKGEIPTVIINRLYKQTQLQTSFGIIFLSISNGIPKVMNIKEMLVCFLDHRREVVIRRTIYELKKAKERAHILEGLKVAVENVDEMVEIIKKSEGPSQARTKLIERFSITEIQSQAILDMKLQRLTGLERDKIIKDYNELMKLVAHLESVLSSEEMIKGIIKEEFTEILEKYGDERKTEIIAKADEINMKDLIKSEEVIVTITHKGYIKRMALDTYKAQKRGGTGLKGSGSKNDEDFFTDIFTANTHSTILFFTSRGLVFSKKVYDIPEGSRTAKGRNLVNLLQIPPGEKIREIIAIPDEIESSNLIFSTERGLVKKSKLTEYKNITQKGIRAIKIQDGDNLLGVRVTDGTKDILLCATSGKIIRFSEEDCRAQGRVSQGVKGITLTTTEKVIGLAIIDDSNDIEILSVTEKGFGKRTQSSQYRKQSRGGKGILAMKLTDRTGDIVKIKPVTDKDDIMIITNSGQVIRSKVSGISLIGRNTQGVKLINLKGIEKVVAAEKIVDPVDTDDLDEE